MCKISITLVDDIDGDGTRRAIVGVIGISYRYVWCQNYIFTGQGYIAHLLQEVVERTYGSEGVDFYFHRIINGITWNGQVVIDVGYIVAILVPYRTGSNPLATRSGLENVKTSAGSFVSDDYLGLLIQIHIYYNRKFTLST